MVVGWAESSNIFYAIIELPSARGFLLRLSDISNHAFPFTTPQVCDHFSSCTFRKLNHNSHIRSLGSVTITLHARWRRSSLLSACLIHALPVSIPHACGCDSDVYAGVVEKSHLASSSAEFEAVMRGSLPALVRILWFCYHDAIAGPPYLTFSLSRFLAMIRSSAPSL